MRVWQISFLLAAAAALASCDDFANLSPDGAQDEAADMNNPEGMVRSAYAIMGDDWFTCPLNLWPYGDVASDDGLKGGGGITDTGYHVVETWTGMGAGHGELDALWAQLYVGVSRCNRAIMAIRISGERKLGADVARVREAEMRFLRAHFYFKLIQMFRQVPWFDEEVYAASAHEQIPNDEFTYRQLMQKVIDDFAEAYAVLPEEQDGIYRATKIAAACYLAKCHLTLAYGDGYEGTNGYAHVDRGHMGRVVEYTDVVVRSKFGLLPDFADVFLPESKNSIESIFAVQHSGGQEDDTVFGTANWSNVLNGAWGIWTCGWDFHKPSQDLVNAFKTRDGLPMFDDYDATDDHPVNGRPTEQKWDPRLFHTVGMPTFPYKYESQYTLTTRNSRDPATYGYYCSMKEVPQRSRGETCDDRFQSFAMNEYVFRYADVLLMRAEALIELDQMEEARQVVNAIRDRAKNSTLRIGYAADQCEVESYPSAHFATKELARRCLRWERRLELAMEGHRLFDLRRWGLMSATLNRFFRKARASVYEGRRYGQYYGEARFVSQKNEFYPIPSNQIDRASGLHRQNRGY